MELVYRSLMEAIIFINGQSRREVLEVQRAVYRVKGSSFTLSDDATSAEPPQWLPGAEPESSFRSTVSYTGRPC